MADGSLSSRVYENILSRILGGQIKPGDVFNRRQIASEMKVSVAPVLEAMLELESEGLIETLPRRGTRVREPNPQDVWGDLVVREALECQAARLYHGDPIRRHHARLTRLASDLDGLDFRSVEFVREEVRFHHYLVSLAECPRLTESFERVTKLGLLHAAAVLNGDGDTAETPKHTALIEQLLTKDADAAESAIRAHLRIRREPAPVKEESSGNAFPSLPAWLDGK